MNKSKMIAARIIFRNLIRNHAGPITMANIFSNIESGEFFFKGISFHQHIENVNAAHASDR